MGRGLIFSRLLFVTRHDVVVGFVQNAIDLLFVAESRWQSGLFHELVAIRGHVHKGPSDTWRKLVPLDRSPVGGVAHQVVNGVTD